MVECFSKIFNQQDFFLNKFGDDIGKELRNIAINIEENHIMIEPNKGFSKWSTRDKTAMIQEFIKQKREYFNSYKNPCVPPVNDLTIKEIL